MSERGFCSTPDHQDRPARLFPRGSYCGECVPAPEFAPGRYCLAICYCGQCVHRDRRVLAPITPNVIDFRAVASGKRRAGLGEYREAQANTQDKQQRGGDR